MAKSLLPKQAPQDKRAENKRRFIRQLAEFLAGNQVRLLPVPCVDVEEQGRGPEVRPRPTSCTQE